MLTRPLLLAFGAACTTTWLTEHFSFWIAHAIEGMMLVLFLSPGMIPAFFGLFSSEYVAWIAAVALTTLYYFGIWKGVRTLRAKDREKAIDMKSR